MNEDIKLLINSELQKRDKSIRNKNAIDAFLKMFPGFDALKQVLLGSKDAIELEKQKLTIEAILNLVVAIDKKLSGEEIANLDAGLKILIENATSDGDIIGLDGKTSNPSMQKIFEKPLDVRIKDSRAHGNITGVKLEVDDEVQVKDQVKTETDLGKIKITPQLGSVVFGKGFGGNNQ